ncbi:MAG: signal peptidase II [Armatimonadetes bacterium]|nr:signal peptidase II [Armatimonadota bacterium]
MSTVVTSLPQRKRIHPGLFWGVFIGGLVIDQIVKAYVRGNLAVGQSHAFPLPGILEVTLTYNRGIAFGMLQGLGILFIPVALAMAWFASWYAMKKQDDRALIHWALGFLASGAIGNLIDRMLFGHVTDMLWVRFIQFPVFNFADCWITFGAILLAFHALLDSKPQETHEDKPITNTGDYCAPVAHSAGEDLGNG